MTTDQAVPRSLPRRGEARNRTTAADALLRLQALRDALLADPDTGRGAWTTYLATAWPDDSRALAGEACDDACLALDAMASARGYSGKAAELRATLRRLERTMRREARAAMLAEQYPVDLDLNPYGKPKRHIGNLQRLLVHDLGRRFAWNEFTESLEVDGARVSDTALTRVRLDTHARYELDPGAESLLQLGEAYAREHRSYHPVRDYLDSLVWDGVPRLGSLLARYLGAEDTPLHTAYSVKTLVAAVRRVYQPGCKVDTVLILQGKQGRGKSTALRVLGGEWFRDAELDPGTKDASMLLRGAWLYELGEFEKWLSRSNLSTIKAMVTRQDETYRPPYGKVDIVQPRQLVFVGTTNTDDILTDPTGHRRFWVVRTGAIDLQALTADRDQLWAEAVAAYTAGAETYLSSDEVEAHAAASVEFELEDARQSVVAEWLGAQTMSEGWTTMQVMRDALGLEPHKVRGVDGKDVAAILRRLGLEARRTGSGIGRATRWYRPRK
jgi:hypothetical protein